MTNEDMQNEYYYEMDGNTYCDSGKCAAHCCAITMNKLDPTCTTWVNDPCDCEWCEKIVQNEHFYEMDGNTYCHSGTFAAHGCAITINSLDSKLGTWVNNPCSCHACQWHPH